MPTEVAVTPIPPELSALTPKQRAFVLEYVKTKNGTQAARNAGYRGNDMTLNVAASKLIRNGKVAAAIDALVKPGIEKALISIDRVMEELADIGFADWRDFVRIKRNKQGEEIEAVLLLKDKIAALKLCGDHVGAFKNAGDMSEEAPRLQIVKQMTEDEARSYLLALLQKK